MTMNFLKRLGIFLIGLSIGMVILAFFFRAKSVELCYFPNCRVLKDIRSKEVMVSTSLKSQFDIENLKPIFWKGKVDFKNSDTHKIPCRIYTIKGETTDKQIVEIVVENCFKKAIIQSVKRIE